MRIQPLKVLYKPAHLFLPIAKPPMRPLGPLLVLLVLAVPHISRGEFTTVDFSASANSHLQTDGFNGGIGLPDADTGNVDLGGVPFDIPTDGNNFWLASLASGDNPRVLSINVAVQSATEVDTLSHVRRPARTRLLCVYRVSCTGGAYYRQDLIGGTDIRDYNDYIFTNTINGTSTTQVLSYDPLNFTTDGRLDKQEFTLPSSFLGQTLTTINLVDNDLTCRIRTRTSVCS